MKAVKGQIAADRPTPLSSTRLVPPAGHALRWNTPLPVPLHGRITSGVSKVAGLLLDSRAAGEEDSA